MSGHAPAGWRRGYRVPQDRPMGTHRVRRRVLLGVTVAALALGATACGGGDSQGRQDSELRDVESQVAQLRLEVRSLRQQVQALRESVPTTTTSSPSTATATTSSPTSSPTTSSTAAR